jgi:hypothetical protein
MPSDKDYKETKQIMLGKKVMQPEFKPLAEWIDKTYGVQSIFSTTQSTKETARD